ncbi:MAG: nicotinate (nicotinamide) nucleotide adenylyltransferase [Phycisphaerae bacterium]
MLLFGGSFDPIHHGHLVVSRHAAEALDVDRVVLIPGASPPHKRQAALAPAADRLELCRLAVRSDPLFEVSDWETRQAGPNYTLHTVRHFQETQPQATKLYWLIGLDSLAELSSWYRVGELVTHCTLVTAGRPGAERPDLSPLRKLLSAAQLRELQEHILETPLIDISATNIRARVHAGLSIRYLVPEPVRTAIAARGLYGGGKTSSRR